jgi:hypothetical protein
MRLPFVLVVLAAVGCGKEIGDSCIVNTDCDPNGTRMCDMPDSGEKDGYCTIMGCDYNTCPSEAVCVRFFSGEFENESCASNDDCTFDQLCALDGHCVPRSSEIRYCMRKCSSNGDCRDGYECRNFDLMIEHGGEPVLAPGVVVDEHAPKFCAAKPAS